MEQRLPVIEINSKNVCSYWQLLRDCIFNASFIGIDTELSGLGVRKKLFCSDFTQRYKNMTEYAQSHATLSVGLSCFKYLAFSESSVDYTVQTFNILVLPDKVFQVQPESLKFLLNHGFDFNKLVSLGLPYRHNRVKTEDTHSTTNYENENAKHTAQDIFRLLVSSCRPLVLHNGFVDLVFLYQHFYEDLPKNLESFSSVINDLFPLGVYDTKYLSEFVHRAPATYLQFVYVKELLRNKCLRQQHCDAKQGVVSTQRALELKFLPVTDTKCPNNFNANAYSDNDIFLHDCFYEEPEKNVHQNDIDRASQPICKRFAYHGWCKNADLCLNSHGILRIVKEIGTNGARQRCTGHNKKKGHDSTSSVLQAIMHCNSLNRGCDASDLQSSTDSGTISPIYNRGTSTALSSKHAVNENSMDINENNKTRCGHEKPTVTSAASNSCKKPRLLDETNIGGSVLTDSKPPCNGTKNVTQFTSGHSAGVDAFMTAYIFASYLNLSDRLKSSGLCNFTQSDLGLEKHVNKIYAMGKDIPFLIRKSPFGKISKTHEDKLKSIRDANALST